MFLAHRSRRLSGELIELVGVRRLCPPNSLNISSETTRPIKSKFLMEPLWLGEKKVCSNGPGHMTKMAAMPIYGKNLKKIFSGTKTPMTLKLDMQHVVQSCQYLYEVS